MEHCQNRADIYSEGYYYLKEPSARLNSPCPDSKIRGYLGIKLEMEHPYSFILEYQGENVTLLE